MAEEASSSRSISKRPATVAVAADRGLGDGQSMTSSLGRQQPSLGAVGSLLVAAAPWLLLAWVPGPQRQPLRRSRSRISRATTNPHWLFPDVLYLRAEGLERRDEISNCRIKSQSIIYLPLESKSAKMLDLAQRKPRKILI